MADIVCEHAGKAAVYRMRWPAQLDCRVFDDEDGIVERVNDSIYRASGVTYEWAEEEPLPDPGAACVADVLEDLGIELPKPPSAQGDQADVFVVLRMHLGEGGEEVPAAGQAAHVAREVGRVRAEYAESKAVAAHPGLHRRPETCLACGYDLAPRSSDLNTADFCATHRECDPAEYLEAHSRSNKEASRWAMKHAVRVFGTSINKTIKTWYYADERGCVGFEEDPDKADDRETTVEVNLVFDLVAVCDAALFEWPADE